MKYYLQPQSELDRDLFEADLTWTTFQNQDEETQARLASLLVSHVAHEVGASHTNAAGSAAINDPNSGCQYVKPEVQQDGPDKLVPVCLVGHVFCELDGFPDGFESRDAFLVWLKGHGFLDTIMSEKLKLHKDTAVVLTTAQAAADEQVPWGAVAMMADRLAVAQRWRPWPVA